ncbi:hypothetical protein BVRB_019100, partial [Beta vulgaris subsp. vulgaris]
FLPLKHTELATSEEIQGSVGML